MRTDGDESGRLSHEALFYSDAESFLAGTVPFVLDGLARGESVTAMVPGSGIRRLETALGSAAEQVRMLDMNIVGRNPGRLIPATLTAAANAHTGPFRVIGEPMWPGRSDDEYPACVQHEALVNVAFAHREARLLCPYDVSALSSTALTDAESTHSVLVDGRGVRRSERYAPDAAYEQYNLKLSAPADALTLPFDLDTLAKARRTATDVAARAGMGDDRLSDVALAVGEVCANSVQHGGGGGVLAVWSHAHGVVCEVRDQGRPSDRLAGRTPAALNQHGGRGLLLVNEVCDLVRTYAGPEGLTTRIYLRR